MKFNTLAAVTLSAASLFTAGAAASDVPLPSYEKVRGISGNFSSVGSDTLANMMTFWAEQFKRSYPNINIQIQAAGSSTAPPALTEGTSQFGPMSRKMKSREIEAFEKRYGYKPTQVRVAIDALAVFVNKDNPIEGLTIKQLDAIFSATQKCGASKNVLRWADVGLAGSWSGRDMQLFGRNSVSGTYGYFKKKALCKGDFKNSVNEQPGSASVVQSVASSLNSIGYSGIGYQVAGVKAVALSKKGGPFIEASMQNAVTGKYPLSRFLYVYVNKHPNKPLSPLQAEFLKMVLSQQGQAIVKKDGYIPLPGSIAAKELAKLGLN
ncbi:PstS family phosphate ABC transporter substrate-binding protein [Psychromonas aquimarina]|uniref:PstS family phosphate ABC transporter substrate-binding protein n=1 Tax=Psychromonas aquimarina TaxID=444919 RepID=UPI00048F3F6B|nr:phosphate ABC transporter substrate-binding protein PstS family protein [Psychromonas aquimarina]